MYASRIGVSLIDEYIGSFEIDTTISYTFDLFTVEFDACLILFYDFIVEESFFIISEYDFVI